VAVTVAALAAGDVHVAHRAAQVGDVGDAGVDDGHCHAVAVEAVTGGGAGSVVRAVPVVPAVRLGGVRVAGDLQSLVGSARDADRRLPGAGHLDHDGGGDRELLDDRGAGRAKPRAQAGQAAGGGVGPGREHPHGLAGGRRGRAGGRRTERQEQGHREGDHRRHPPLLAQGGRAKCRARRRHEQPFREFVLLCIGTFSVLPARQTGDIWASFTLKWRFCVVRTAQTTTLRASTPSSPTTEMIVSITDQLLIV
jgi:hypothetical protein